MSAPRISIQTFRRISVLAVISFFCLHGLFSQSYPLRHFSEQDGLPGMTVYSLLEDHAGYLWLATNHGLCRYNGQHFERIDSPEIEGYEILSLSIDSQNRIWFSSFLGQICYYSDGKVTTFNHEALGKDISILDIFVDSRDNIWIGTRNIVYQFKATEDGRQFELVKQTENKTGATYFNFTEDTLQQIWTTAFQGVGKSLNLYRPQITPEDIVQLPINHPGLLYVSPSGKFYMFQAFPNTSFFEITDSVINLIHKDLPNASSGGSLSMIEDPQGELWLATRRGVLHFDKNKVVQNLDSPLLYGIQVNDLIIDREGNYWFGTNGEGLYFMPSKHIVNYNKSNSGLADDQIYSITHDQSGRLWLGMAEGKISVFNHKDFESFSLGTQVRTMSMYFDEPTNKLYAGTDHRIFLKKGNQFKPLSFRESIKSLSAGNGEYFWVATGSNAYQVYPQNDSRKVRYEARSYGVFTSMEGEAWLSTKAGVLIFNDGGHRKLNFPVNGPSKMRVTNIVQSSDSTIWMATYGQGIFAYKNGQVEQFTSADGLTSNICKTMIAGDPSTLWIGTDKGLNKMNLDTREFIVITILDGLSSNMINTLYTYNDNIYVGTPKGLSVFQKSTNFLDTLPPLISIDRININERDTAIHPEYVLPYFQNDLQIDFRGVAYKSADQLLYKYRMLGLHADWRETRSPSLAFRRLEPGKYRFEVKSVNADGVSSTSTAVAEFEINPHFMATAWFKIIMLLSVVGLLSLAIQLSIYFTRKNQQREQAIKEKIDQLRMQALQAQMNPHFIFNALNAILHLLSVNDRKSAIKYLAMFARLIRLIFEHSKKNKIPLDSEFEFLRLYLELEKLRFEEKVAIEFFVDEAVSPQNIKIPPLLIQPIIENAFKHGLLHKETEGTILIKFEIEGQFLKCTIEDNGVGREKARELGSWRPKDYLSSGLKTTEERLFLLNKSDEPNRQKVHMTVTDLVDSYGESAGTRVELSIETT
ncbi:MAG: two-component regulator propeller domain-containing protein [Bacteroidota bacterium]